jgi:putative effector of murein hydrolase LrgA (UPF0299 family)
VLSTLLTIAVTAGVMNVLVKRQEKRADSEDPP